METIVVAPPGCRRTLVIDCHGHYTMAPAAHTAWREAQVAVFDARDEAPPYTIISENDVSVETLAIQDAARHAIYEGKVRRVFPRLDAALTARGL